MAKFTFEEDSLSRNVMRLLLVVQLTGMVIVLRLSMIGLFSLALAVSFLTFLILVAIVFWLYVRYRNMSIVRKKSELERLVFKFQKIVRTEENILRAATRKRDELTQAEKSEQAATLTKLQGDHIQHGLASTSIEEATIPGVGPKLKERLASYGILNADHVNSKISELPGIGSAKRQALLSWRDSVVTRLEGTKPARLTDEQIENIEQKYQALHNENEAAEKTSRASKQVLEYELKSLKPHIEQLSEQTFENYISKNLASRGMVAALVAFLLIMAQVVSSVSAATASLLALMPPAAATAPATLTVIDTFTPAIPDTPAITNTPVIPAAATLSASLTPADTPTAIITVPPQPTLPSSIAACIPTDTLRETALVVGVVDGDTIDVRINDEVFRVRYIGINTPEQDQALFSQATAYNQELVTNKTVTLVKDISETDAFNRLLRYVIAGDAFVNYELVNSGYAEASAYAPDTACVSMFETAQRQAQMATLGLWMQTPTAIVPVSGGESTETCDPAYPGVCIPPPPPDLDCGDISFRRFQVLSPDPHGFDRDQDGIGCES